MKFLALGFFIIFMRVQNLFLAEHFLKMSTVQLFLQLLFHVVVQHIEIQETTLGY